MTFYMETSLVLKKRSKIYEIIPIELFVDTQNLLKFIEISHKTMLENLIPLNVFLKINLKGESFDFG